MLPSLSVPPPMSPTMDDRKHLGLLWAAKARLIERNPVHGFLVAAGIKLNDADDEFIEAIRTSHAAYHARTSYTRTRWLRPVRSEPGANYLPACWISAVMKRS